MEDDRANDAHLQAILAATCEALPVGQRVSTASIAQPPELRTSGDEAEIVVYFEEAGTTYGWSFPLDSYLLSLQPGTVADILWGNLIEGVDGRRNGWSDAGTPDESGVRWIE